MSYRVFLFASIHYDDHAILDLYRCYSQGERERERVDDDRFHTLSIYYRASFKKTQAHTRSDDYHGPKLFLGNQLLCKICLIIEI